MNRGSIVSHTFCGSLLLLVLGNSVFAQIVSLSPKRLAFGPQVAGTSSLGKKVILTNTDTANPLSIVSITPSGNFTETNSCGSSVAPLAACTITVGFAPTSATALNGAVTITDGAPGSPHIIGLTGTGTSQVSPSPVSLAFGAVAIGSNITKSVKVTNNTTGTVSGLAFASSGDYSPSPGSPNPCGSSLASKASCNESVTFAPTAVGALNGAVLISDSAANSPQVVTLTGTGSGTNTAPITLSPASLSFGRVLVGSTSAALSLTLTNTGANSLAITIAASGDYSETPSGTMPCGANLAGGANCTVSVTFSPAAASGINGSVNVSYAGTNSPQLATLSGTGIAQVTTSLSSLTFAGQPVTTISTAKTVKLTNNTVATVAITSITASGNYSVLTGKTGDCGSSLAAGSSCNVRVAFVPTHSGSLLGSVTIVDAATDSPQLVALSGVGLSLPRFAYTSGNEIPLFTVDTTTGQLTSNGLANSSGVYDFALDPTDRFFYGTFPGLPGYSAFTVDASTGLLTLVDSVIVSGSSLFGIAVDPSGRFVYMADQGNANLYAFTIDLTSGALVQITGSPYALDARSQGVTVDPSGKFVYVANTASTTLSAFSINSSTGALTPVVGSPYSIGNGSDWVAVDPAGKFVYVSNFSDSTISEFTINPITGTLSPIKGSPVATGTSPLNVTIDPSGRFLYVSNLADSTISGYSINPATGALTVMRTSPFATLGFPHGITTDPSGKFLYNVGFSSNDVYVFGIDPSTGALTLTQTLNANNGTQPLVLITGTAP
jgi:6-phosphogluconolactonase (cycloisomerase 2 family)